MAHLCTRCQADISDRDIRAQYCDDCRLEIEREKNRIAHWKRKGFDIPPFLQCERCGIELGIGGKKYCSACRPIVRLEKKQGEYQKRKEAGLIKSKAKVQKQAMPNRKHEKRDCQYYNDCLDLAIKDKRDYLLCHECGRHLAKIDKYQYPFSLIPSPLSASF
jgi:hypothetical protein